MVFITLFYSLGFPIYFVFSLILLCDSCSKWGVCWQNNMKNVKCISSSEAYILVKDQLAKAKAAVVQYQALLEKLQVVTGW